MSNIVLASGVVVEDLGSDLMVMVPGSSTVLTLSGRAADVVRTVQSGSPIVTTAVVTDLIHAGVLETTGLSRRGLVKAGAIGAGAGIAVMAMPGIAAASSDPGTNPGPGTNSGAGIELLGDALPPEQAVGQDYLLRFKYSDLLDIPGGKDSSSPSNIKWTQGTFTSTNVVWRSPLTPTPDNDDYFFEVKIPSATWPSVENTWQDDFEITFDFGGKSYRLIASGG